MMGGLIGGPSEAELQAIGKSVQYFAGELLLAVSCLIETLVCEEQRSASDFDAFWRLVARSIEELKEEADELE